MKNKQICSRCVLDTDVQGIHFDKKGVCQYCKIHDKIERQHPLDKGWERLKAIANKIKYEGKNKKYDCIMGVSGGTDSTYCLYLAKKKLGLNPLAVHFDNGWDSEIAVQNIKNATARLGIDLHTVVADWDEFKDLQLAFLKASVPEMDLPTDNALRPVLYKAAVDEGVSYVLHGHSFRTEGKTPAIWSAGDGRYLKYIYKKFGKKKKLQNVPTLTLWNSIYFGFIKRIKHIRPLYYVDYDKDKAKELITKELGWTSYGGKHHESIYTRFVLGNLLPKKFNIDTRKVYLSALIRSGQIDRDSALKNLEEPHYSDKQIQEDVDYVVKKLGITHEEFQQYLARKPKNFLAYPSNYGLFIKLLPLIKLAYKFVSPTTPPVIYEMESIAKGKIGLNK